MISAPWAVTMAGTATATDLASCEVRFKRRTHPLQAMWFWFCFVIVTLTVRRISPLVRVAIAGRPVKVEGLESLPDQPAFSLALNHFHGTGTLEVIAAVLTALRQGRPELIDRLVLVAGQREIRKKTAWGRFCRRVAQYTLSLWSANLIRIPLDNADHSIRSLREWRKQAGSNPSLVFPEGKARLKFGALRPGAGAWQRALSVPTIPVGVWLEDGVWHVRFGRSVKWSERQDLSDVQLGLAIAELLPRALTPEWNSLLERRRELRRQA